MSDIESQELYGEHQVEGHRPGQMVCPACLSLDLKAKAQAVKEECARIADKHGARKVAAAIRKWK